MSFAPNDTAHCTFQRVALAGAANLIIYLEGAADDLVLNEGGDRIALNYGPDPLASRSG
jgi:hypothetical protein